MEWVKDIIGMNYFWLISNCFFSPVFAFLFFWALIPSFSLFCIFFFVFASLRLCFLLSTFNSCHNMCPYFCSVSSFFLVFSFHCYRDAVCFLLYLFPGSLESSLLRVMLESFRTKVVCTIVNSIPLAPSPDFNPTLWCQLSLTLLSFSLETKVKIGVSVRGRDVYIIQSGLGWEHYSLLSWCVAINGPNNLHSTQPLIFLPLNYSNLNELQVYALMARGQVFLAHCLLQWQ